MTPDAPAPSPVSVRGGAAGIEVFVHDLTRIAERLQNASTDTAGSAVSLHGLFLDVGDLGSVALDPVGYARFAARLTAALDGPHGLVALAARCAVLAELLRDAARIYQSTDDVGVYLDPILAGLGGLPAAAGALAGAILADPTDPSSWLRQLAAADPQLAPLLLAGLAVGTPGLLAGTIGAAAYLAGLKVDAVPGTAAKVTTPPRTVEALLSGLRDATSGGRGDGSVIVRFLTYPNGTRRVIVDISGMNIASPVTGLPAAATSLTGATSAYQRGVVEAMTKAGVTADDDVMLVGHSEGGMVAVNLAADPQTRFKITHVITAGSPIGQTADDVPPDVQVLAIENDGDAVPTLDGRLNTAAPNCTTVTVHHNSGDAGTNHGMDAYVPGGRDVDASTDPSVAAYEAGMAEYLHATSVISKTYTVVPAR